MQKYLWLAVEADEYELPIAVADTAKELGEILGVHKQTVITAVARNKSGALSGRKFIKVINDAGYMSQMWFSMETCRSYEWRAE